MAQPTRRYFATLTALIQDTLDEISLNRLHYNPDRVIWEVHGSLGEFDIRLKEIFNPLGRRYSYYVILSGKVAVGFDNYPDRRALQRKYGQDFTAHLSELIPHKHSVGKTTLDLTEAMSVDAFLDYLHKEVVGN